LGSFLYRIAPKVTTSSSTWRIPFGNRRYPKGDVGVYCLAISSTVFIDICPFSWCGASANASRDGIKPNAKFVLDVRSGSARLQATRRIRVGDEIFVSYGRNYWIGAASCSHSTVGVPEWEWDLSDPFAASPAISTVVSPVAPVPPTSMSSPASECDCPPSTPPTNPISAVPLTSMSSPTPASQPIPLDGPVSSTTVVPLPPWCPPGGVSNFGGASTYCL